jgi:hypothetical protein
MILQNSCVGPPQCPAAIQKATTNAVAESDELNIDRVCHDMRHSRLCLKGPSAVETETLALGAVLANLFLGKTIWARPVCATSAVTELLDLLVCFEGFFEGEWGR